MSGDRDPVLGRRSLLALGATGVGASLAGCFDAGDDTPTGPPEEPGDGEDTGEETADGEDGTGESDPIPYAEEYDRVVDLVADAGADPTGESSVVSDLEAAAGDDTLVYLPPGRYLLDDQWMLPEFRNLGVVGRDATVVPKPGYFGYLFVFGLPDRPASGLRFEGIEFDFTATDTAPRPIQVQVDDGVEVRDVRARGTSGTARFDVTSSDGSGLVRNLRLPDGGMDPNPVGVLVGPANRGRLRFEDCHVEGFPDNGLYASPSNGPVEVVGGYYANNAIASVRVSSPAVVRGVTVRCDEAPSGFRNMRGIRLRNGESVTVEDCTIEFEEVTYSDGALVVEPMMESATIRDVDISVSADGVPAINARNRTSRGEGAAIECEGVSISGEAASGAAVRIVDRDECLLEGVDIEQSGADRDGVHLLRSTQSVLRDCVIDVTGESLVLEQSTVRSIDTTV